jgi:carbamoyltransferase
VHAVADAIRSGELVAACRGRLEFGPRALGARSLLLDASDPQRALALDHALGRDPVMPFGPLMTAEVAPELLQDLDATTATMSRYMTVALPATERLRRQAPAAVHLDGTARAQLLGREEDPALHAVLRGLPDQVCINTSLNRHHEPIVHTADEAARCALSAGASVLWLDDRRTP